MSDPAAYPEAASAAESASAAEAAPPLSRRESQAQRRRRKGLREMRIVSLLNAGVSVAEIGVRLKLTERRTRQLVQDILNRRAPHPPAAYAALQVSRLHEALIVAHGAMGNGNLAAVDRVAKLVRELDRYHGFAAAQLSETPTPGRIPGAGTPLAIGQRKRIASQPLENAHFAEGNDR